MSSRHPPLEVRDVRKVLRNLGFEKVKGEGPGSHEVWKKYSPHLLRVDVDPPKAPFSHDLISAGWGYSGAVLQSARQETSRKDSQKSRGKCALDGRPGSWIPGSPIADLQEYGVRAQEA